MLLHIIVNDPEGMWAGSIISSVEFQGLVDPIYMMIDPGVKFDLPSEIDNTNKTDPDGLYYTFGKEEHGDLIPGDIWMVVPRSISALLLVKYSDKILLTMNHLQMKTVVGACSAMLDKASAALLHKYIRFCHKQGILNEVMNHVKTKDS
jgi:hypothetical protein